MNTSTINLQQNIGIYDEAKTINSICWLEDKYLFKWQTNGEVGTTHKCFHTENWKIQKNLSITCRAKLRLSGKQPSKALGISSTYLVPLLLAIFLRISEIFIREDMTHVIRMLKKWPFLDPQ